MFRWLAEIVDSRGFPARWMSGPMWQQQPWWGWMHIAADVATWAAYVAIPLVILRFVRDRRDLPFSRLFWLFGALLFAGGTGHLLDALMFWWPAYRLSAVLKLTAAAIAWVAVGCLVGVVPKALAFRSPRQLEREVDERTRQLQEMADRLQTEVIERRRMLEGWNAREQQLQIALQAGRMGTWDWDLVTHQVQLNATELELLGLTPPDGPMDADEFFDLVHPDDRAGVTEAVEAAIRRHHAYDHEFRIIRPTGGICWLGGRGEVLRDKAGTPVRMTGINFDVSRRKRDEEALRQKTRAIEFATNGVVITDALLPDCPISFVNPAFEALTGYTAAEVVGRNCRFLQGPDTDPETAAEIHLAVQQHRECNVTILNYRKDGRPFWNDLRIAPIFDERDRVTHFVGIQSDVTERIDAEYELFQAREAAVAANRAKSRFLASMSHEIRTPLTAVLGCADVLSRRLTSDPNRELALVIRNQGEALLQLLNDLLDLSKIEAGKLDLRIEPSEVRPLVEAVRKLVEPLAAEKGIELTTSVDEAVPAVVGWDPLRIRQILLNLLSNSVKFTDAGRVELQVRTAPDAKDSALLIELRDTGVGIPADQLTEIFEEFSQVEGQPAANRGPGTGLGLAIVHRLVHLHGGVISVDSRIGKGTTFHIRLPIKAAAAPRLPPPATLARSVSLRDGRLACRLLIAEDTRSLQFMLNRMLEDQVAELIMVSNGQEAVDHVRPSLTSGHEIDIVLMDMQMPVLNGYEATRQLRSLGYDGAIIALTAGAMTGEREKCLAAGCTDYLPKPLDRDQLLRTLRRYASPVSSYEPRSSGATAPVLSD